MRIAKKQLGALSVGGTVRKRFRGSSLLPCLGRSLRTYKHRPRRRKRPFKVSNPHRFVPVKRRLWCLAVKT